MRKTSQTSWVVYSAIFSPQKLKQVVFAVCDEADWADAKQQAGYTLIRSGFQTEEEAVKFLREASREHVRLLTEADAALPVDGKSAAAAKKKPTPRRYSGP